MVSTACLFVFLLTATATDVLRHRIYNWTTYTGILAGVAVNAIEADGPGLQESLAGFLACGFLMLVCFVLFNIGGGDVKLIAMMGAFLGLQQGIEAMLWTFVVGSVMGVAILIWQIGFWKVVTNTVGHLRLILRAKGWVPLSDEEREPLRRWLFLAPSALVAVTIIVADREFRIVRNILGS